MTTCEVCGQLDLDGCGCPDNPPPQLDPFRKQETMTPCPHCGQQFERNQWGFLAHDEDRCHEKKGGAADGDPCRCEPDDEQDWDDPEDPYTSEGQR